MFTVKSYLYDFRENDLGMCRVSTEGDDLATFCAYRDESGSMIYWDLYLGAYDAEQYMLNPGELASDPSALLGFLEAHDHWGTSGDDMSDEEIADNLDITPEMFEEYFC